MTHIIRAVYKNGVLHPVTPIELQEDVEVHLEVLTTREAMDRVLGSLLVKDMPVPQENETVDEEAILREIDEIMKDQPPLSEVIIEERRTGP